VPVAPPKPGTERFAVLEALVRNQEATSEEIASWVYPPPRRDRPFADAADWRSWRQEVEFYIEASRRDASRHLGRLQECGLVARCGPASLHGWVVAAIGDKGINTVLAHIYNVGLVRASMAGRDVDPDDIPGVEDVPLSSRSAAVSIVMALFGNGPMSRTALHRACTGGRGAPRTGAGAQDLPRGNPPVCPQTGLNLTAPCIIKTGLTARFYCADTEI